MRLPRKDDFSDVTNTIRNKYVSICHNNEKHVDDFESGYSTESVLTKEKGVQPAPAPAPTKKGKLGFGSSSKPDPNANILGADPVVKTFYEGERSRGEGHYDWCEFPPRQMSKKQALKSDRVAIKLYKIKDCDKPVISGRFSLKNYQLEIQNPILITALKPILNKQDVYLDPSEMATFYGPFRALYFCSDEIAELQKTAEEPVLKQQLTLLLHVMGEIFGNVKLRVKQLQDSGLMSYQNAWIYYPKDSMVYAPGKDTERMFKVVNTRYEQKPFPKMVVKAREITFDGKSFAWMPIEFEISPWAGNKPITDVRVYPLQFHPEAETTRMRMLERGRKVLEYQGLTYCKYTGVAYFEGEKNIEKHNVDCRILIDVYGYSKHHVTLDRQGGKQVDTDKKRIEAISRTVAVSEPVVNLEQEILDYGLDEAIARAEVRDAQAAEEKKSSYIKRLSAEDQAENREAMLENEGDLVYVSPMLRGYALQNKLWLQFYVDDVQPVVWNDDAYEHLVYPEEQKDLVLSFVENHQRTRTSGLEMDDVIKGKGQGLVLLLSGPPGTGKTLTAEAVADKTRRPLYYLQAEDLGINAAQLGANLKKVFEMATEWDAVILLDEADVFMAERNPQDIARNELVSIFLRELEYFRGIIFLTTNLYNTIDSAFRSRVNIHLLFNSLSPEHRMILWKKFLERLPPMKEQKTIKIEGEDGEETQIKKSRRAMDFLSEDDMKELSQWDLNGREIKNAIKTVKSWCDAKAYDFSLSRLESGIRVTAPNTAKRAAADDSLYD